MSNFAWTTTGSAVPAGSYNGGNGIHEVAAVPASSSRTVHADGDNKNETFNPYYVAVQSKFRRKYYHKTVFLLLVLAILILIITVIVLATKGNFHQLCESKECLRTASSLLLSMDTTANPCEDFYQFTCGNWNEEHPRPDSLTSYDWFTEKQGKVTRRLREFLQANQTEAEPQAVRKAKLMYRACMDTDTMNKLDMEPLVKYLREFQLPVLPTVLNASASDVDSFDWIASVVEIKMALGMDLLVGFEIYPDPVNGSVNKIAIGTPESGSALPFNDEKNHLRLKKAKKKFFLDLASRSDSEEDNDEGSDADKKTSSTVSAYLTYIKKVAADVVLYLNPQMDMESALTAAEEPAKLYVAISKKIYKFKDDAENTTKSSKSPLDDILYITVDELQNETNELIAPRSLPIWRPLVERMLADKSDFDMQNGTVLTSRTDIIYLQYVTEFLLATPQKDVEFYLWMNVVEELALHTTSDMRRLHHEYMSQVISTEGSTPRSLYCTNGVNSLMGMAASQPLAEPAFLAHTLPRVRTMLQFIHDAFGSLVRATSWMDAKTKVETQKKSAHMKNFIGFPEWIINGTLLDAYYSGVTANETTHLENMIGVLKWESAHKIRQLNKPNTFGWATSPSNVNAFHTFQANAITVPIAILQFPFYELGLEALNYGSIGTILGHELTHGFDDSGRMFDKSGNMRQWWSNATITEYVNRTQCFVDQYDKYYLPDVDENINGDLTLGENIADNGGLREAYYAYKLYVQRHGREKLLPGLERFSHEQLLFIAFGNLWCESYTPAGSRYALEDSHCPGRIRLKGVLSNSPEFAKVFGCRKGSGMYPSDNRCRIW